MLCEEFLSPASLGCSDFWLVGWELGGSWEAAPRFGMTRATRARKKASRRATKPHKEIPHEIPAQNQRDRTCGTAPRARGGTCTCAQSSTKRNQRALSQGSFPGLCGPARSATVVVPSQQVWHQTDFLYRRSSLGTLLDWEEETRPDLWFAGVSPCSAGARERLSGR